ncbi:ABC transporter ATP-binding protein [Allonocardiopsis opalescens]|uniref:ABC-2 type transport system ATP-binding protein n=1 Tax=Allonocardiopsis opalescens TaxID=1144618 RepID=A0A2T0PUE7_9ACTN|nr:ABC transporter ATP-binding protein [Allonocardiopsis opalescens]PRX92527.1 ABC-2 type transport system ATP-binding protein [Allonocardiopsis opalescens]
MGETGLDLADVVKRYGDTLAVAGVSLTAERGAVTALLGPNGAGKTTTLEICEGFRRPDSGRVRVLGLDPARDAAELRPRVGVMPQSGGVPSGARAGEWLRLVARFHAHPVPPGALLERLALTSCARTPFRRLSGGQQQRLSLAAAVVGRPELVFLDEPTAGLDPQSRHAAWEIVRELRAAGVAVVLTTHYLEEAERLADRVVVIDRGRVAAAGTPAELTGSVSRLRFSSRDPVDLAALTTALPAGFAARALSGGQYVVEAPGGAVGPELIAAVAAWCASRGVLAEDLRIGRRTLEDAFLELTGHELREP